MGIALAGIYSIPHDSGIRVMASGALSTLLQLYLLITIVMERCVRSLVELYILFRTLTGLLILPGIMLLAYIVRLLAYDSQAPDSIIDAIGEHCGGNCTESIE
jgi:ABC-type maltose transport system permease subunit